MPAWTSHLKRIKNGCILLQSASDPVFVELKVSLLHIFNGVNFRIGTVLVPQQKPITRRQYIWCKRYWPTAFHPNKSLERMLDGSYFTEIEKARIIEILFEAIQIGGCGPGCVIVDAEGNVVAKSGVNTQQLLRHSVMSAVAILCEIHKIDGSDVLQYLGTGFDVYLTDEPCCMCAMALVHFRVGRVFFHRRSPKNGAFESRWRIQEEKRLNHHYQVFRIDEIC